MNKKRFRHSQAQHAGNIAVCNTRAVVRHLPTLLRQYGNPSFLVLRIELGVAGWPVLTTNAYVSKAYVGSQGNSDKSEQQGKGYQ